jgi:hypothetical protein
MGWPLQEKNQVRMRKRILSRFRPFGVAAVLLGCWVAKAQNGVITHQAAAAVPLGKFVDVTMASGVHFQGQAYHTAKKYLIERPWVQASQQLIREPLTTGGKRSRRCPIKGEIKIPSAPDTRSAP